MESKSTWSSFGAAWSGGAAAAHGGLQVESFGMCLHLFSAKADLQLLRDFYKIENNSKNYEIFTQYIRHIYVCAVKISTPSELFCPLK